MNICILGEGAWGTAIATVLARNGHTVSLWCHDAHVAKQIRNVCMNERYLPNISLCTRIKPTTDIAEAISNANYVFEAIPVQFLRSVIDKARPYVHKDQTWVVLSKGIEQDSLLFPSDLITNVLNDVAVAVCAGPSFAHEVARSQPTAIVCAAKDITSAQNVRTLLENDYFHVNISADLYGVQICAAFKNVAALGAGILLGLGYGNNTRALFITRSMQEMVMLTQAYGGTEQTAYGLAGLGDLVLTCVSSLSKNMQVGRMLGEGMPLNEILSQTGHIPEGINTINSLHKLAEKKNITLPIAHAIHSILFYGTDVGCLIEAALKS